MSNKINNIFKAIADPTRREIFHVLVAAGAALSVNQVSEKFEMSRGFIITCFNPHFPISN